MGRDTQQYAEGTSVTQDFPWGLFVSAKVMCSDGVVRTTKRISQTADTFFSVPCSVRVKGKTVSGYLTIETAKGYSTVTDDDPAVAKFLRVDYGKNADLLPKGAWRKNDEG